MFNIIHIFTGLYVYAVAFFLFLKIKQPLEKLINAHQQRILIIMKNCVYLPRCCNIAFRLNNGKNRTADACEPMFICSFK